MSTRNLLLTITLSAIAFALPGCVPTRHVVIDRSVPHRLSQPADVYVLERQPDGTSLEEPLHAEAGWIIAAPELVEPKP